MSVMKLFANYSWMLVFLFFLNALSNAAITYFSFTPWIVCCVISVAALFAVAEFVLVRMLTNWNRPLGACLCTLFALFHNLLIITDYYLIHNFNMLFAQDVVDILAETNLSEIENFTQSFMGGVLSQLGY